MCVELWPASPRLCILRRRATPSGYNVVVVDVGDEGFTQIGTCAVLFSLPPVGGRGAGRRVATPTSRATSAAAGTSR